MRRVLEWSQIVWLAQTFKNRVSLFEVAMNRSQKVNKPFIPEITEYPPVFACIFVSVHHQIIQHLSLNVSVYSSLFGVHLGVLPFIFPISVFLYIHICQITYISHM